MSRSWPTGGIVPRIALDVLRWSERKGLLIVEGICDVR